MVAKRTILNIVHVLAIILGVLPLAIALLVLLMVAANIYPGFTVQSAQSQVLLFFSDQVVISSIFSTIKITLIATLLAIYWTYLILKKIILKTNLYKLERFGAFFLALPHVSLAIGILFLFSSSGMLARIVATYPFLKAIKFENLLESNNGWGVILALALKETFFLVFVSIAPLRQLQLKKLKAVSASLGYSSQQWFKIVFIPLWIARIRMPIAAVVGYSVAVIDIPIILGSQENKSLAHLLWQSLNSPYNHNYPKIAIGCIALLFLGVFILAGLKSIEWAIFNKIYPKYYFGHKRRATCFVRLFTIINNLGLIGFINIFLASILLLVLWSISFRWSFPNILPQSYTLKFWTAQLQSILPLVISSLSIAISATLIALFFVICELERKNKGNSAVTLGYILVVLILPQLSLVFGLHILAMYLNFIPRYLLVVWGHFIFVFPYMYLSLVGTWKSFDQRYIQIAASLGYSPLKVWLYVKWPLLKNSILKAVAIAMSVSLAQYLVTMALGGGRIETLTTQAVAVTAGYDRRIMAIYGILQAGICLLVFLGINRKDVINIK